MYEDIKIEIIQGISQKTKTVATMVDDKKKKFVQPIERWKTSFIQYT